jgi:protein-S-isoprenylcysteine O-methyltransferase Ste14
MTESLIIACWLTFAVYWAVSALSVKATSERQSLASALPNRCLTFAGGVLLLWRTPPHPLEIRVLSDSAITGPAGIVVCLLGLALAIWSRTTLGRNWSSAVMLKQEHELVERGPYRFVRHPIYSAIFLMSIGSAVALGRISCWLGIPLLFVGFWMKLRQEELLLTRHFPVAYPDYMRRVKALVPRVFVWAACICAFAPVTSRSADAAQPSPPSGMPTAEERRQLGKLADEDRRKMMEWLHLSEPVLPPQADDPRRPSNVQPVGGASPNWTDGVPGHTIVRSGWGSWSNYDLAKADRYPLPDALTLRSGEKVTDADTWWKRRRPEILDDFLTEIYGRIPARTPKVTWEVAETDRDALDGKAMLKRIVGHIDNSGYPAASPSINIALYVPANATGPVPVMAVASWNTSGRGFGPPPSGPTAMQQVVAHGWGYALIDTYSIQADSGGGLGKGIIGLVSGGEPRKPDDWGALAAWSWGLSRAIDYFETDKDVDAKRLGIEGHSRWGKEALLAAALDERWAIVYSSCSGECGAKLHRHDVGESVDNVCGSSEYHWMAGNFLKYAGHWDRLPVDQHELLALVAPRPVFIGCGTQDLWSDPVGEFEACVSAGPVYRLLGSKDLGATSLPPPDAEVITGDIGFRMHSGGHTDLLDWPAFLTFADKYLAPAKTQDPPRP